MTPEGPFDERPIETHCPWCEGAGAAAGVERARRYADADARGVLLTAHICPWHAELLRKEFRVLALRRRARRQEGAGGADGH